MGGYYHFLLLFFLVVVCAPIPTLGDDPCDKAICGEGKCVPSNTTVPHYDCLCNHGWKKVDPIFFVACVVPNCTIDFSCGSPSPPPPPPPPPPFLAPFDPFNLCNFVWCGEGTCVVNDTAGYYCQCNPDSTNLLGNTAFPCFKKCNLGIGCSDVELGLSPPPPPSTGSNKASERWAVCMVLLSTIILAWKIYE